MAEQKPDYLDIDEVLDKLDEASDRDELVKLVDEGSIPSLKYAGKTLVNEIEAINIVLKFKGGGLNQKSTEQQNVNADQANFQDDLTEVLAGASDEELFAFGKSVLVKKVGDQDFTIDYIKGCADRSVIIDSLEDQFRKIGSDIFERGTRDKPYRDILYICARKLKGVPYYKEADTFDLIPKPYPKSAVAAGINPRKLVHADVLPTDYMEFVITKKLIEIIWENMTPENRKTFLKSVIGELSEYDNLKETEKELLQVELTKLLNSENGVDKDAIKSIIPLLVISAGQISGFGAYIFATTAAATLAGAIGLTLPFVAYTALTTSLSVLLGPVGMVAAGLFAGATIMKPNYRRLYPAISIVAQIRNRP